ncbi:hypothetical protein C8Q74DRAFT_1372550 [Fomes fomentarius]|nr:hypothetical protein C8Q74DRAFT_1372550 [Fomes fomentarius]
MSIPRANYDPRRVCINPFPALPRTLPVSSDYCSHFILHSSYLWPQFALANWTLLDAAILSAHAHSPYDEPQIPPPVHDLWVRGRVQG